MGWSFFIGFNLGVVFIYLEGCFKFIFDIERSIKVVCYILKYSSFLCFYFWIVDIREMGI